MNDFAVAGLQAPQTPLLERGAALQALGTLLEDLRAGEGSAMLYEGVAGLGKTRLLQEAVRRGHAVGVRSLIIGGSEIEQLVGWGVTRRLGAQLIASLTDDERAAVLEDLTPRTRALLAPGPQPVDAADEFALVHGAFTVLARVAEAQPVLLTLDDLHWVDRPSLTLLLYLLQRLRELPVALVLARRPSEPGTDPELTTRIAIHPHVRVLPLDPLGKDAVAALVTERFGSAAGPTLARACWELTAGNPLLLDHLVDVLRAEPAQDEQSLLGTLDTGAPEALAPTVLRRLARLGEDAEALARAAAILGDSVPLRQAARVAELDLARAAPAADRLSEAHILAPGEPLQYVHPLVASAVRRGIEDAEQTVLRRRAARLLHEEGEPSERVAAQLMLVAPARDPWAVQRLSDAATAALAMSAADSAVQYLRRALQEPAPSERHVELLGDLALAEAAGGFPEAADRLREAAARVSEPGRRGELDLALVQVLFQDGRLADATAAADEAIGRLPSEPAFQPLRDALQLVYVATGMLVPALVPEVGQRSRELLGQISGEPTTLGQRGLLAQAAAHAALVGEDRLLTRDLAERAWGDGELMRLEGAGGTAWTLLTAANSHSGNVERAIEIAEAALSDARVRGLPMAFATAMYIRGSVRILEGRIADSVADLEAALDARRYGWRQYPRAAAGYLASGLLLAGQAQQAESVLDAIIAEGFPPGMEDAAVFTARAEVHLAAGRYHEALADIERVKATTGPLEWLGVSDRQVEYLAQAGLGEVDTALDGARAELERAGRIGVDYAQVGALRALGMITRGEEGVMLLRRAVALGDAGPPRLETLRARIELGIALRHAGAAVEARDTLRAAMVTAQEWGATGLAGRARSELLAAGGRIRRSSQPEGPSGLTPSERRIALLAADGLSNRQIAEDLFVTTKTVEYHLRNAFAKLGVQRRTDLAGRLGSPT